MESKKIIEEMTNLLNKLQISTNCQTLHPRLKHYLRLVTKAKVDTVLRKTKEMESKPLDDNQNLGNKKNFVFTSSDVSDNLEDKAGVLKNLLGKYQNLPEQCKPRALPVKEYIERHLGMLNNMLAESDNKIAQNEPIKSDTDMTQYSDLMGPIKQRSLDKVTTERERFTTSKEKALIEEQLEDLGLGDSHNFKPNFDLDEIVAQNRHRKDLIGRGKRYDYGRNYNDNRIVKRHSESYEKLLNAIAKEKLRKLRETRLGQMYGKFNDDLFTYNEKSKQAANDFESPQVYSF